jgi:hypothetical protein
MNSLRIRHSTSLLAACLATAILFAACPSPRPATNSYLENGAELGVIASERSPAGLAASFALWCTDTAVGAGDRPISNASIGTQEANSLRVDLAAPPRPVSARVVDAQSDGAIVAFRRVASDGSIAPVWLALTLKDSIISAAALVRPLEDFEIYDALDVTINLLKDIAASGTVEGAGLGAAEHLDPASYPDLATLRTSLRGSFSPRTVESVIRNFGCYQREGLVWMPARDRRSAHNWDRATLERIEPGERGFVARLTVATRSGFSDDEIAVPFVLTRDGWRIDEAITP